MFFDVCDICNPVSVFLKYFEDFYNGIKSVIATHSKSNQLKIVNTVRWEYRNITTQPGKIDDRKSEVIAIAVNAGMNITANILYI